MSAAASNTPVESLLAGVRRRLWATRLLQALRVALWAWAAIMATVAVLHALTGTPGLASAVALGTAAVLVAIAWAAAHRPDTSESALYADRHLGGQSGYSTWLEASRSRDAQRGSAAWRRLAEWTASAVPASRRALDERRVPWRLARPLAAAAICTSVAAVSTMLGLAEPAERAGSRQAPGAETAPAGAPRLDDAALAESLAAAMAEPTAGDPATPVGPGESGRGSMDREDASGGRRAAGPPGVQDSSEHAASSDLPREASGVAAVPATGREAGTTRDDSGPGAGSRAAPGTMNVQRRDVNGSADAGERMADDERKAGYEDDAARAGAAAEAAVLSAAAARAPAARRDAALSPVEAAYVEAWREAAQGPGQEQR